jgi:hypothetical protein
MDLAFDNHRIDDRAEIVDGRIVDNVGHTRFRVDLHFTDMHTRREDEIGGIIEGAFLHAWLNFSGVELVADIGLQGHPTKGHGLVRALHGEGAVLELHVIGRGLHQGCGQTLALGLHLVESLEHGGDTDRTRA